MKHLDDANTRGDKYHLFRGHFTPHPGARRLGVRRVCACVLLDGGSTKQMISVIVKTAAGFHALQSVCHTFSNGAYRVTEPNS